jgi:hypothetical protein
MDPYNTAPIHWANHVKATIPKPAPVPAPLDPWAAERHVKERK